MTLTGTMSPADLPALTLLLYELRSPINVGMILRVAETYGVAVSVIRVTDMLAHDGTRKTISDFACGALERKGYDSLAGLSSLPRLTERRVIATSIEPGSISLAEFRFARGDVLLLGNEYDGLPTDVAAACQTRLRIPMADVWTPKPPSHTPIDPARSGPVARDGMPNLNVALAAGIICYQWFIAGGGRTGG